MPLIHVCTLSFYAPNYLEVVTVNKKTFAVLCFLADCILAVLVWCINVPIYICFPLVIFSGWLPGQIVHGLDNYRRFLQRVPYYSAILIGTLIVVIVGIFMSQPANSGFILGLTCINSVNCFILVIYQFHPDLLHLKDLPEENEP